MRCITCSTAATRYSEAQTALDPNASFAEYHIPAGETVAVNLIASLSDAFFGQINWSTDRRVQQTEEMLLKTRITLKRMVATSAGELAIPEGSYDLFYLPDIADSDRDDAVINFGRTLEGKTRTMRIDHPDGTRLEVNGSADAQIAVASSAEHPAWSSFTFTATGQMGFPHAELEIYHDGRHLTAHSGNTSNDVRVDIQLKGQSVPKMEIRIGQGIIETAIQDAYNNPPTDPAILANSRDKFVQSFSSGGGTTFNPAAVPDMTRGINDAIQEIYGTFQTAGDIDIVTGQSATVATVINIDNDMARGELGTAHLDFALTSFEEMLLVRPDPWVWRADVGQAERRTIQGNLTPASKLYRLRHPLPGGDRTFTFHRLAGDADGDKHVDSYDLSFARGAYGSSRTSPKYRWYFDFEGDGDVDSVDWQKVLGQAGKTVVY